MKTLQEQAYQKMLDQLESGHFKLGEIYSETKTAQEFGISRTPLRSALIRLEHDGLIDILPGRGFMVHELTNQDIINTYQIRMAVEGFCAMNLAEPGDAPQKEAILTELRRSVEAMRTAIEQGRPVDEVLQHDLDFHQTLVQSCENAQLSQLYEQCIFHLKTSARMTLSDIPGRKQQALSEHQRILASLEDSDSKGAASVYSTVLFHLEKSRDLSLR